MKKAFLLSLLLLTGCGYLPSTKPSPGPTVTVTATVTATPETTKASITPSPTKEIVQVPPKSNGKATHQIRFEGKQGTKVKAGYIIMDLKNPTKMEETEGVLPFTVDLDIPSDASVSAYLNDYGLADDVKPKVFIYRHGKDCGKIGTVGNTIKNPEASKVCAGEMNLGQ